MSRRDPDLNVKKRMRAAGTRTKQLCLSKLWQVYRCRNGQLTGLSAIKPLSHG